MAVAMLIPALADLRWGSADYEVFVESSVTVFIVAALVLAATRGSQPPITMRVGFLLAASLWLTASILGALPLYYSYLPISFARAVFESVSGITTTGATALTGLEHMPHGILLWRSLLCWIGGVGFITVTLLLLPSLRAGSVKLSSSESSSTSEKVLPRVHQIANAILLAYLMLSFLCALSYFVCGMSMFDAINNSMTTMATAGYSTHDSSFAYYADHPAIFWVSTIFMILASLPFAFFIKAVLPKRKRMFADEQIKWFICTVIFSGITMGVWIHFYTGKPLFAAVTAAFFNFTSLISTTGYMSEDYGQWGGYAFALLFLSNFPGGCSGSTAGGIKFNRIVIFTRLMAVRLTAHFSPSRVMKVRYGGEVVSPEVCQSVSLFVALYLLSLMFGTTLLLAFGCGFETAFTGALTTLSNVGPGFGPVIGPTGNFSTMDDPSFWVLSFLMLIGRLELVTIFVLFIPSFWRD